VPRKNPNSRLKDIVDMVLLIGSGKLDKDRTKRAIEKTFLRRKTHSVPGEVVSPPLGWEKPFRELADECELNLDIHQAYATLIGFMT